FYDALATMIASPVVAINRAVAIGEVHGPAHGLAALDRIAQDATGGVADYQPYWAARAGLLARADRLPEAAAAFDRAIGLESDPAVRRY
ncbi:RNA polymerase subunit sigma-24, partial [Acinetobacter baumannii]